MDTKHRLLRPYVCFIALAGAYAGGTALAAGRGLGDLGLVIGLIVAGVLAERFRVGLFGDSDVSVAAAACMAAAIAGTAGGTVAVAAGIAVASGCFARAPWHKTAFNAAVSVLASLSFRIVFQQFRAANDPWPNVLAPAVVASATDFLVNVSLVALVVVLATRRPLLDVIREKFVWLAVHHLPLGALAVAFAAVNGSIGAWAIVVFAIPLASIQVAMKQYSAAKSGDLARLRDAHNRIVEVEAELARLKRDNGGARPASVVA